MNYIITNNSRLNITIFRFLTSDGQEREESGTLEEGSGDDGSMKIEGFYSYAQNGELHKESYKADKEGVKFINAPTFTKGLTTEPYVETVTTTVMPNQTIPAVALETGAIATLAGGGLG